jgi:hypothetical protein
LSQRETKFLGDVDAAAGMEYRAAGIAYIEDQERPCSTDPRGCAISLWRTANSFAVGIELAIEFTRGLVAVLGADIGFLNANDNTLAGAGA